MTKILLALAVLTSLMFAANHGKKEATMDHSKMDMNTKEGEVKAMANGVLKGINVEKKTITLDHEPIPQLKWPAMTMDIAVSDIKITEGLKDGDKIHFTIVKTGKTDYVITKIMKK